MDWIEVYRKYGITGLVKELARVVLCAGISVAVMTVAAVALVEALKYTLWN